MATLGKFVITEILKAGSKKSPVITTGAFVAGTLASGKGAELAREDKIVDDKRHAAQQLLNAKSIDNARVDIDQPTEQIPVQPSHTETANMLRSGGKLVASTAAGVGVSAALGASLPAAAAGATATYITGTVIESRAEQIKNTPEAEVVPSFGFETLKLAGVQVVKDLSSVNAIVERLLVENPAVNSVMTSMFDVARDPVVALTPDDVGPIDRDVRSNPSGAAAFASVAHAAASEMRAPLAAAQPDDVGPLTDIPAAVVEPVAVPTRGGFLGFNLNFGFFSGEPSAAPAESSPSSPRIWSPARSAAASSPTASPVVDSPVESMPSPGMPSWM